jgi:tetratricopeptide (TPR) repeat protein
MIRVVPLAVAFAAVALANVPESDALAHYQRADYATALRILSTAPVTAATLELTGQCQFMLGDYKKSTDSLERAANMAPAEDSIQLWLGRSYGRKAETAFALNAFGLANKARAAFEKAVQINPLNRDALEDLFDFYFNAPPVVGGGKDKASRLLPAIERVDPAEYHNSRARLLEDRKQFSEAEAELRKAVSLEHQKPGQILNLAKFLSRMGRFDESEKAFEQAARMAPDSPMVLLARAESYILSQRNLDQARSLLKKYVAADLTPEDSPRAEANKLLHRIQGA